MCKLNSAGQGSVEHYRNIPDLPLPVYLSSTDKIVGFSNIAVSVVNGQVVCSFRRAKSVSSVTNYFDVKTNPSYYILTATGSLPGGRISQNIYNLIFTKIIFYFSTFLKMCLIIIQVDRVVVLK